MRNLTKPYDLFDVLKTNFVDPSLDNFLLPLQNLRKPLTNIREMDGNLLLEMAVPGFKKTDIEISIDNNILSIKGNKTQNGETKTGEYIINEYLATDFTRSFKISSDLNTESVNSKLEDGILTIQIPKSKKAETKKLIQIQ